MEHSTNHTHSSEKLKDEEKKHHEVQQIQKTPEQIDPNDVKTLLTWTAPSRPFRKRKKAYYVNLLLIMFTLEVILFLFSLHVLMLLVVSLAFVSIAFATTPPGDIHYRISTEGITLDDHFYLWQELYDFYFKKRSGMDMLHIRTKAYLPGELVMLLGDVPKEKMRNILIDFLPYREVVRPTFTEKAGDWLASTFPLDETR